MDGKNADTTIDLHECTVVTAEQETSQPFSFKITCPRFKSSESSSVMPGFVLLAAENAWELGAFHPVSFLSYPFSLTHLQWNGPNLSRTTAPEDGNLSSPKHRFKNCTKLALGPTDRFTK